MAEHPKNDEAAEPMSAERLAEIEVFAKDCKCWDCREQLDLLAHIGVLTRALESVERELSVEETFSPTHDEQCIRAYVCGKILSIARTALGKENK